MSKKCPKCESNDIHITHYPIPTDSMATCYGCGYTDLLERFPEQTVFDRITASVETLADRFVYYIEGEHSPFGRRWKSTLTGDVCYVNRSSAFEATIEELKKEWKI